MPDQLTGKPRPLHVVGLCGYSGAGKTTLATALVSSMSEQGLVVSAIKHAHHAFDPDIPGKDSWKLRQAGAFETLVTSDERWALIREFPRPEDPDIHALIAELAPCDWVLVEGFKHGSLPKIDVWREASGRGPLYPHDSRVVAVATDGKNVLPAPTSLPLLPLDDPRAVARWLLDNQAGFLYIHP